MAIEQTAFRIYEEGTESGSVALGDLNRGKALVDDTVYLVRIGVASDGVVTVTPKLQYRVRTTAAGGYGTWTDVNATSSYVRSSASANIADDAVTTERLAGAGTFTAGRYDEVDGAITTGVSLTATTDTEFLFAVKVRSAELNWRNIVQLRLVESDDTVFDTYDEISYPYLSMQGSMTEDFEVSPTATALTTSNTNFDTYYAGSGFTSDSSPAGNDSFSGFGDGSTAAGYAAVDEVLCPEIFFRVYLYATGARATNTSFMRFFGDTTPTEILYLRWDESPVNIVAQCQPSGNNPLGGTPATDQWIRVEGRITRENVAGTSAGKIEVKYWNTASDTGAATGSVDLTQETSDILTGLWLRWEGNESWNYDDLEISNIDWIGPVSTGTVETVIRPIADTAGTGWDTAPTGSQALYAQVDEETASDTDYMYATDPNP